MRFFLFLLIILFSLILRLYKLAEIPGEWFGDISNVHEYTQEVMKGEWPFYFLQSPGPVYHYLIAPYVLLTPYAGYLTYKLVSVLVGMAGIWGDYLLAKEMFSRRVGLVTAWLMSFSFWPLVWSRLGNSQIVIPVIFAFGAFFFIRFVKKRNTLDILFSGFIASLGWYTYPQTFIFVPILFVCYLYFLMTKKMIMTKKYEILLVFLVGIVLVFPLFQIIQNHPYNFESSGYIGKKTNYLLQESPISLTKQMLANYIKTFQMLYSQGDRVFRVNVSGSPIIDSISTVFIILSIIYLITHNRIKVLLNIFIIICLLLVPSVLPTLSSVEIPSSSRSIAIQPLLYLLIAFCIRKTFFIIQKKTFSYVRWILLFIFLVSCFVLVLVNISKYFTSYVFGLPNNNFATGKKIAEYIDNNINSSISVYFASCCWTDRGEPEPKAVAYTIQKQIYYIADSNISDCKEVSRFQAIVIFGPYDKQKIDEYRKCFPDTKENFVVIREQLVFVYI